MPKKKKTCKSVKMKTNAPIIWATLVNQHKEGKRSTNCPNRSRPKSSKLTHNMTTIDLENNELPRPVSDVIKEQTNTLAELKMQIANLSSIHLSNLASDLCALNYVCDGMIKGPKEKVYWKHATNQIQNCVTLSQDLNPNRSGPRQNYGADTINGDRCSESCKVVESPNFSKTSSFFNNGVSGSSMNSTALSGASISSSADDLQLDIKSTWKWNKMSLLTKLERSSQHLRLSGKLAPRRERREALGETHELISDVTSDPELSTQEEEMSPSQNLGLHRTKTNVTSGLDRILNGPLAQNNPDLLYRHVKHRDNASSKSKLTESVICDLDDKENDIAESYTSSRSKTMPPTLGRPKMSQHKLNGGSDGDRLRNAKDLVERAIKYKKVFTIQGGYSTIRHSLRRRGWVEKFYKIPKPPKKTPRSKKRKTSDDDDNDDDDDDIDDDDDGDDTDDDNDQPKIPPWEEDDGIYGIMSRMVRNVNPSFIWVLKNDAIDYRFLNKDQMVNHFCKAGSFTTKVGLCMNMKNVSWFDNSDPDAFFPRCYRLSNNEDKVAFIDDYRLTACTSILKVALNQTCQSESYRESTPPQEGKQSETQGNKVCDNPDCTRSRPGSKAGNKCVCPKTDAIQGDKEKPGSAKTTKQSEDGYPSLQQRSKRKKKQAVVPVKVLETAIYQCEKYLAGREHDDIDVPGDFGQLTDGQWDDLIQWYYQLAHEDGNFTNVPSKVLSHCENILHRLATHCPQLQIDGTRNVWIVKPGAKSRGRGITCYDKLEDMLKLVSSQVVKKDGKYVVQKYIERPLLIYNTKFDIRQWFLVTDWNPLTLWFYQDSYLRFCSQQYTLEDFDRSIHLSNNAIQAHYKNGPRSSRLPVENMWSHQEFKEYLISKKQPNAWDDVIYPGMRQAIICALLVTQDVVECRKSSFELYGADFMLTEDLKPWLIEINSGPSMESSTSVTAKLCTAVLDDTIKVAVDRKFDRNCDVGRFELAFKQPVVTVPPYIGISLCVEGQSVRRPNWASRQLRQSDNGDTLFTPRVVTMRQTFAERQEAKKNSQHTGSSSAGASLGGGGQDGGHHSRKDHSRSSESTVVKSVSCLPSRGGKDQQSQKQESSKSGSKSSRHSAGAVSTAPSSTTATVGGEEPACQTKTLTGKKSHVPSEAGQSEAAATDSSAGEPSLKVQNGPIPHTARVLPNTPYLAGLNQRRFVSKTSVSTNYTIPMVAERGHRTVSVNNVESTELSNYKSSKGGNPGSGGHTGSNFWHRTCPWCGRGGNLHLDSADPNCRCQQDSVLVTSLNLHGACIPQDSSFNGGNYQHPPSKVKKPRNVKDRTSTKRNAISVTPNYQTILESPNDDASYGLEDYVSQTPVSDRPVSAVSGELSARQEKTTEPAIKSRRVRRRVVTLNSHIPPDVVFSPLSHQHSGWQMLKTSQQTGSLYPPYGGSPLRNKTMQGSTCTNRVKSIIAQKSAPSSINKYWPSYPSDNSYAWYSPLSVVAQRRLNKMYLK